MRILPYSPTRAEFRAYDPDVREVARLIRGAIQSVEPRLQVEHVGSTSVPGCGGKGIIDLAILYPEELLTSAKAVLDGLGFQRQGGPEPFPENRPMRVGCVEYRGRPFRVHAHVIALGSKEHDEMVWFRETLSRDSELRQSYEGPITTAQSVAKFSEFRHHLGIVRPCESGSKSHSRSC